LTTRETGWNRTVTGILDRFRPQQGVVEIDSSQRLEGRTCLVTGANCGLGKAIAVRLAERGAHVIMACRSGIPEAGHEVRERSGSGKVEMLPVDLSDFASIHQLCDQLRDRGTSVDIAVLNAAVVTVDTRSSAQGLELMFAVNYLSNVLLLDRLLADSVIPSKRFSQPSAGRGELGSKPRILVVSSEDHRVAEQIDFSRFGQAAERRHFADISQYGQTKLMLTTWAQELSRRLNDEGDVKVAVHTFCPGAVNTSIAREAPWFLKLVLAPAMRLLFKSPEAGAAPAIYLATALELEGRTGSYLHYLTPKEPAPQALDPVQGKQLWERSAELIASLDRS
jgi:NAD(P)-dependent dehydrogenase (short-subunit alcohol dehydrogenase family)